MSEQNKFRPFLIGIVDGSLTNDLSHELYKKLEGCPICTLSMSNYLKDGAENEANPESVDFELLLSDLLKLLNNEECTAPIYDFNTKNHINWYNPKKNTPFHLEKRGKNKDKRGKGRSNWR